MILQEKEMNFLNQFSDKISPSLSVTLLPQSVAIIIGYNKIQPIASNMNKDYTFFVYCCLKFHESFWERMNALWRMQGVLIRNKIPFSCDILVQAELYVMLLSTGEF